METSHHPAIVTIVAVIAIIGFSSPVNAQLIEEEDLEACASATTDAECGGFAVSGTGDADSKFVAISGAGNADAVLAASGFGNASGGAAGVSGDGNATGLEAVSGTGNASACYSPGNNRVSPCLGISGTGDAEGDLVAVSGTNNASGDWTAFSALGCADAFVEVDACEPGEETYELSDGQVCTNLTSTSECDHIAVSITGDARCNESFLDPFGTCLGAVSVAGDAGGEDTPAAIAIAPQGTAHDCFYVGVGQSGEDCLWVIITTTGDTNGDTGSVIAVSGTGNAGQAIIAVSGTNSASGWFVASGNGDAMACYDPDTEFDPLWSIPCVGISGVGDAQGNLLAVSGTNTASGWIAVSGTGNANGEFVSIGGCDIASPACIG